MMSRLEVLAELGNGIIDGFSGHDKNKNLTRLQDLGTEVLSVVLSPLVGRLEAA